MTVVLLAPHWSANVRIQRAANNNPPMRQHEGDTAAVRLLQAGMILAGFTLEDGADGKFGPHTASTLITIENFFGYKTDVGVAGREVLGALDLMLRGYDPPPGPNWGGLLAKTIVPFAQKRIIAALKALNDIRKLLKDRADITTANAVTTTALKTHFKLVPVGRTKLAREEFIALSTIDPLIGNFGGIQRTLANPKMIRHTICSGGDTLDGLNTAAEAPFGGPVSYGPPYSDFKFDPVNVTNIAKTGQKSLAAMMMHEATHVIDSRSGFTPAEQSTTHISETEPAYETQAASFARHNPSAFATFAAHIDDGVDQPRAQRFGLGGGRSS